MYGFGAKLPPYKNIVSQNFSMNGNYFSPNISRGAEALANVYKNCIKNLELHGPTVYSEIVQLGRKWADSREITNDKYIFIDMI